MTFHKVDQLVEMTLFDKGDQFGKHDWLIGMVTCDQSADEVWPECLERHHGMLLTLNVHIITTSLYTVMG